MSQKKDQLEDTAQQIVQRSGLSKLSFRTLADEVGVKSSSVHYYFREKGDLAEVIIENYSNDFLNKLKTISQRHKKPISQLEAFIKLFDEVAAQDKFCLCGMMAAEVDSLSDRNRKNLLAYFTNLESWLTEVLKSADPVINMAPDQLAKVILSGLEGALLVDRVEQRKTRLKAQRSFVRMILAS